MNLKILKLAAEIANKLDCSDTAGKNGKIDYKKWNVFAKGKGKSIKNYITLKNAKRSIAAYLSRQSRSTGKSYNDLGQKWLDDIDKDMVAIKSNKSLSNKEKKKTPVPKKQPTVSKPKTVAVQDVQVKTNEQNLNNTAKIEILDEPGLADDFVVVENPPVEEDTAKTVEAESPTGRKITQGELAEHKTQIDTAISTVKEKWKYTKVPSSLMSDISSQISEIEPENLSTSAIVKRLKSSMYPALKKVFGSNVSKISTFIRRVANTVMSSVTNKNIGGTRDDIVDIATNYYEAGIYSSAEGNAYFSGGRKQPWCADAASTIIIEALGDNLPADFKNFSAVSGIREWGQKHNCYTGTSGMKSSDRKRFIASHVKPGDVMIEKRNKSHTGIVINVAEDGSWFETIEGNASKTVAKRRYTCDSSTLSGFVSMDKFVDLYDGNYYA